MPARRSGRGNRPRRQPPQRRVAPRAVEDTGEGVAAVAQPRPPVAAPTARSVPARTGARTRSRAPAQIVIANYDFLRHDLRMLGILAPSLVVILAVLSVVLK
jgi:hypothetical protein